MLGKSTLVHRLAAELSSGGYRLRVAILSIDDLYLPASVLDEMRAKDPDNALLAGRGLPGTHDVALGERILCNVRGLPPPEPQSGDVDVDSTGYTQTEHEARLPMYDKGAHDGRGDRSPMPHIVPRPRELDVFLLEGWCLGYAPLGPDGVAARYSQAQRDVLVSGGTRRAHMLNYPVEQLQAVDLAVATYAKRWCSHVDALIQLWPVVGLRAAMDAGHLSDAANVAFSHVHSWRLEGERKLRTETGRGMDDTQTSAFLAHFMPAYELWAPTGHVPALAPATMLGPGEAAVGEEAAVGDGAATEPVLVRPVDPPAWPAGWDDSDRRWAIAQMPHARPQRILRIDIDARRSVQHFTLE